MTRNNNGGNRQSPTSTLPPPEGLVPTEIDMGYEDHGPTTQQSHNQSGRRHSMTESQQRQRRASIKAILADESLAPVEKRRSIQHLMDGRRGSMSGTNNSTHSSSFVQRSLSGSSCGGTTSDTNSVENDTVVSYGYDNDFSISNAETRRAEENRPACNHYERYCTPIAPCCGAAFGCRICHDDCPVLPPQISNAGQFHRSASLPSSFTSGDGVCDDNDDTHHTIDRFAVREVICRNCYTRQSSKTNQCIECGCQFGAYHCSICNLWMSDAERPYHCEECGFCRVGGAENFLHCDACGMCIDKTLYDNHNCKDGKYKANCPVCQEYLFSSRSASHEMPCGHAIHWECFRQLAAHDSRCPICKKTAEARDRMLPTWEAMAVGVALQPIPPELSRVVNMSCNDCEETEDGRAWHFLGMQCHNCSSFNTVVNQILLSGEEAHEYLENKSAENPDNSRRRSNRRQSIM